MAEIPPPADLLGFGLANYRSFDRDGFVLNDIKKINVLIGKNNSGKSNILRAIGILRQMKGITGVPQSFTPLVDGHRKKEVPLLVTAVIPVEQALHPCPAHVVKHAKDRVGGTVKVMWNLQTGSIDGPHPFEPLEMNMLRQVFDALTSRHFRSGWPNEKAHYYKDLDQVLIQRALSALKRAFERFVSVPVFREFRKTGDAPTGEAFNGYNVISKFRDMQIPNLGQEADRDVFNRIQFFVRDLLGELELTLEIPPEERFLVSLHGIRLPLDSYGTGIHQLVLLCSALAMYENYVIAIEEPEIHLHPELQRKFLRFIAEQTTNTYYITTHSNVFLDSRPDLNVYHVRFDGVKSTVGHAETSSVSRDIITDMGYKASDLLQSNGVIWVEGPSDRIYLNKWLSLLAPDLIEGIHYSIMHYGGCGGLADFSFTEESVDDLQKVLRINRNAFLVVDRDGDTESTPLDSNKQRIVAELGQDCCWVTKGREIENYLPCSLVERCLASKFSIPVTLSFSQDDRLSDVIDPAIAPAPGNKPKYKNRKVPYAREFCDAMTINDLGELDLRIKLEQLIGHMRRWNHIEPARSSATPSPAD